MNKYLFMLSMVFVLSACASQEAQDPNVLPNGIMQPVEGTGAVAGGSFMPEIEQQTMPNTMK
ncbi:hypothetical protein BKK52_12005 [Rodentibacter trehalosifermentans]|uniref:Lipoprotein n=3 Tax=Rodentibacter TaxID=1960084 RepID=A0A1V3IFD6_9PAST|nr:MULTISPECIES: lipoprotein [Rodentibacter]OOF36554.1 hypothetical protein BKK48_04660 [Rodentibacter heidelbergensis]OOF39138.1 hypothetical protein BKK50_10995 [Rodentibacter rarus]OOF40276.1 hypothetical protein BKK49_06370 [Rodentibacter rarus]OOF45829.1 hypothetical protein BKK52_12005 [Rodentibacter trehalosifermentans]